jgi:selenocysteine lyase/cysteine desulfurase
MHDAAPSDIAPFDVERARAETPGCAHVLHLNNAGAALMPQPVLDAQVEHLRREATVGGYEAAADAAEALHGTYDAIARLVRCDADEVALVENATRAWDMAFYAMNVAEGDRILTHRATYASNAIALMHVARRTGASVEVVPSDASGQVDVEALRTMMDARVALVALTHVPTNGGLVNPAAAVGAVCRDAEVPFLLDACQSAGQMPLDVEAIGCTMLSGTGRKFLRGPRGTGFLYVRRDWIERLEPPMPDLHAATWTGPETFEVRADARRFETFESHVAGRLGLGVAVRYALGWSLEAIFGRVRHLAERLRAALRATDGVTVYDVGRVQGAIVTFAAAQMEADAIQQRLRAEGINVSVSTPASTRLDAEARALPNLVRASVHYYNTESEIAHAAEVLRRLLQNG